MKPIQQLRMLKHVETYWKMLKHLKQIPRIQGYSVKCIPGIPQYKETPQLYLTHLDFVWSTCSFSNQSLWPWHDHRHHPAPSNSRRCQSGKTDLGASGWKKSMVQNGPFFCRIFGSKKGTLRINHLAFPGSLTPAVETLSDGLSLPISSNHHSDSTESLRKFWGHPNFGTLPKYTQMGILFTNKRTVQYQKWPAIGPKRYPQSSKRLRSNMSSLLPLEFWRYSFPIAVFEGCRASTCSDSGRDHGRPARVQNGPGDHTGWAHSISFFEKCTSDSLV